MPSKEEIRARIAAILETQFRVQPAHIKDAATFRGTLMMESADIIEFIALLEEDFGLTEGDRDFNGVHTVKQLVDFIAREVG